MAVEAGWLRVGACVGEVGTRVLRFYVNTHGYLYTPPVASIVDGAVDAGWLRVSCMRGRGGHTCSTFIHTLLVHVACTPRWWIGRWRWLRVCGCGCVGGRVGGHTCPCPCMAPDSSPQHRNRATLVALPRSALS